MGGHTPLKPAAFVRRSVDGRALLLFGPAAALAIFHALVPHTEFIHRGDDAFYYFGTAANFPDTGTWTFDGVVTTNGVQPLWAVLLSGWSVVLRLLGVDDLDAFARASVALTGLVYVAANILLYAVLARTVSKGVGLAAAGAFLFSLPLVWSNVWGMENSLYALTLIGAVGYYELWFRADPSPGRAVALGAVLGVVALTRLNAVLLVPVLLVWHVSRGPAPVPERLRHAAVAAAVAGALVGLYVGANVIATGHTLPISGTVKGLERQSLLAEHRASSLLSPDYLGAVKAEALTPLRTFVQSRAADGLWIAGGRVAFDDSAYVGARKLTVVLAALLILPLLVGPPGRWFRHLSSRIARLGRFGYVAVFALVNGIVSAWLYPTETRYAIPGWWLVESELVIVVVVATIVATSLGYLLRALASSGVARVVVPAALVALVAVHTGQAVGFFSDGRNQVRDWHSSWNDMSYNAATWLDRNLPHDVLVGSWNAGVLGYYAPQRVINLDGLINNADLLPHLKRGNVSDYVLERNIRYLSDIEILMEQNIGEELKLTPVYTRYSTLLRRDYRIYRVDGPAGTRR
jgi:hypothetical protein